MSSVTTLQKKSRKKARRAQKRAAKTISPAAAQAREATVHAADATRDWAAPKVETAVDWAAPKVESAKEWAAPKVDTAKEWAGPKVEPAVERVKKDVVPAVTGAVVTALAATEPQRTEIANRSAAALAALRGELEAPKENKHRVRKFLLFATVVGAVYAGWKAFVARNQNPVDAWTTPAPATPVGNVTPMTPETAPGSTTASVVTDDEAGASPDEALADATDEESAAAPAATTEKVTPARAKKVSDAAAKGAKGPSSD